MRSVSPELVGPWARETSCCSRSATSATRTRRCRAAAGSDARVPRSRTTSAIRMRWPSRTAAPDAREAVPRDPARHALPLLGGGALRDLGRRRRRARCDRFELDSAGDPVDAERLAELQADLRALARGRVRKSGRGGARDPPAVRRPHRHLQDRRRLRGTATASRWSTGRPARRRRMPRISSASSCSWPSTGSPTRRWAGHRSRPHRRGVLLRGRRRGSSGPRTSTPRSSCSPGGVPRSLRRSLAALPLEVEWLFVRRSRVRVMREPRVRASKSPCPG